MKINVHTVHDRSSVRQKRFFHRNNTYDFLVVARGATAAAIQSSSYILVQVLSKNSSTFKLGTLPNLCPSFFLKIECITF